MFGISEQYADDIVTYHFLNVPSALIYDKCYSFCRRTTLSGLLLIQSFLIN